MSRKVNFPAWLTSYNWCRNVLRLPNRRCVGGLLCGSQGYGRGLNVSRACGRWWRWMRRRQQCIEFAASDLTTEIASVLVEKRRSASGSSNRSCVVVAGLPIVGSTGCRRRSVRNHLRLLARTRQRAVQAPIKTGYQLRSLLHRLSSRIVRLYRGVTTWHEPSLPHCSSSG